MSLETILTSLVEAVNRQAAATEAQTAELVAIRSGNPANVVSITAGAAEEKAPEQPATPAKSGKGGKPPAGTTKAAAGKTNVPDADTPPPAANSNDNAAAGDDRPQAPEFDDPAEVEALVKSVGASAASAASAAGDRRDDYMKLFFAVREKHGLAKTDKLIVLGTIAKIKAFAADVAAIELPEEESSGMD